MCSISEPLLLLNSVGGISNLGKVESPFIKLAPALDHRDLNGLGHTDLPVGWVGKGTGDLEGHSEKGDLTGLGLIFLPADLVLSHAIPIASMSIGDLDGSAAQKWIVVQLIHIAACP